MYATLQALAETIPSRWEVRRFRFAANIRAQKNAASLPLLSVSAANGVSLRSEGGLGRQAPAEETISSYWVAKPGDIIVNPMWAIEGGIAMTFLQGAVSPAYRVYEAVGDVYPPFLHHLLRSQPYLEQYKQLIRGTTTFDRSIAKEDYADLPIFLPPREEQKRIADFLDAETARIDRAASLQGRILSTLEEREQAHLDIAVDDLLRECGYAPLRRFVWSVDQGVSPQCDAVPADEGEWGVLKVSCLRPGVFLPQENKRLPDDVVPHRESEVREGDLLITRANTPQLVGSTAVVREVRSKLLLSDKIFRVRLSSEMIPDFVAIVARSSRVRALCAASSNGASQSMANIRFEEVKAWPMPLANAIRQKDFVVKVARNRHKIEELKPRVKAQLELLGERRQALITAAVTGQFDVSTASGREVVE